MIQLISHLVGAIFCGLLILGVPAAIMYKYRRQIRRWIKDPDYGDLRTWDVPRQKRAERCVIKAEWKLQDAEDYLEYTKTAKAKETVPQD